MNKEKDASSTKPSSDRCRVCNKPIPQDADHKGPFCSHRCKLQDLSKWFGEEYRVGSHHAPSADADGEADNE